MKRWLSKTSWAIASAVAIVLVSPFSASQSAAAQDGIPRTVAETSDYKATSLYADVVAFCDRLAEMSPVVRRGVMATTIEGRDLPLMILADPPIATAEEARASGKPVIYAQGNIHAGEVCGKEALMMLARDVALAEDHPWLDHVILVICPIYNADGNERISPNNRPGQHGPEEGMGQRPNAQGYDLNRDHVKLESPEARGLVNLMTEWDPVLAIDTHTTNGSFHRYTLTYDGNRHPAGDAALIEYMRDEFLPEVSRRVLDNSEYDTFFYGNFGRDHGTWDMYPSQPRYNTPYVGMRNRLGILTEAYSYASYKDRVLCTKEFVAEAIGLYIDQKDKANALLAAARERTIAAGAADDDADDVVAIRMQPAAMEQKFTLKGYVEQPRGGRGGGAGGGEGRGRRGRGDGNAQGGGGRRGQGGGDAQGGQQGDGGNADAAGQGRGGQGRGGQGQGGQRRGGQGRGGQGRGRRGGGPRQTPTEPADYELDFYGISEPTLTVTRPVAYLIPAEFTAAIEKLQQHGIQLETVTEMQNVEVSIYAIDEVQRGREFQGHAMVTLEATEGTGMATIVPGMVIARTNQPLGSLLVNLLEPESEDGLTAWNFFDGEGEAGLQVGEGFPVLRLLKNVELPTAPLAPQDEEQAPTEKQPITFDVLYGDDAPNFNGSPLATLGWGQDGEHYLQMVEGVLSRVNAVSGEAEEWLDRQPMATGLVDVLGIEQEAAERMASSRGLQLSPQYDAALFTHEGDLIYCKLDGSQTIKLTNSNEQQPVRLPDFSPDGKTVAYVRGFDLYAVDIATQRERALTAGGTDLVRNAYADWVYFEEIYGRSWKGFKWSPDSKHIAFMQFDDTNVGEFTVINNARRPPGVETTRYPKAGAPNPTVKLGVVSLDDGQITWADLASYPADDIIISHYGFYPDGSTAFCYAQDRAQKWLDFCLIDPETGAVRSLFRDENGHWVDNTVDPAFLKDGSFLWLSERTGWKHIYHYRRDGQLVGPVTSGEWEVASVALLHGPSEYIYFNGTKDSHIANNFYRVRVDGTDMERLTPEAGSHRVSVSPQGNYFVDTYSSLTSTPKVNLRATDGSLVRVLDENPVEDLDKYAFGEVEQFQIPARDGFPMEALWVKPPDFDPNKKYPVWFMTYGGPHAPTIRNDWGRGRGYDQMLAQMGILVFRCDPRSASGKGAISTWACYKQMGIQENEDISDAINWLKEHSFVDGDRIGMAGHSYGGFMTAFCMTHTDLFCAGISGAPVTDWHNYDSFYTERYMDTPQANPEGYKNTSVVSAAENLHGRLLLLHGAIDDNVHMQNSMQFIQALHRANKQFELMIYPTSRHGIRGDHYQQLTVDFIKRNLGVE